MHGTDMSSEKGCTICYEEIWTNREWRVVEQETHIEIHSKHRRICSMFHSGFGISTHDRTDAELITNAQRFEKQLESKDKELAEKEKAIKDLKMEITLKLESINFKFHGYTASELCQFVDFAKCRGKDDLIIKMSEKDKELAELRAEVVRLRNSLLSLHIVKDSGKLYLQKSIEDECKKHNIPASPSKAWGDGQKGETK